MLANILQMNQRVLARHLRRIQRDRVLGGPPKRATAVDRMAFAIGSFQPGTLLRRRVHGEGFTRDRWQTQSVFYGCEFFSNSAKVERRRANAPRFTLFDAKN